MAIVAQSAASALPAQTPPGARACTVDQALTLIAARRNVSAKRLAAPGPTRAQLQAMFAAAAAAPDHGRITPWRFVVVPPDGRDRLAQAYAQALVDRDPEATIAQIETARTKARRAPVLIVAIARLGPADPDTPPLERMVSLGAAIQNLLLAAHAMGFAAGLTSGRSMASPRLARLLRLADGEVPVCCVNVGTVDAPAAPLRQRPAPQEFVSTLG